MNRHGTMWSVTLCVILGTLCISWAQDPIPVSTEVADATFRSSVELFKAAVRLQDGNAVLSPMSVSVLLALLQQGSGGNTVAQLNNVLHLDPQQSKQGYSQLTGNLKQGSGSSTVPQLTDVLYLDPQQFKQGYSQLTGNLKESSGNVTLEFANAAFLKEGYDIKPQFETIVEQDFQSTIKPTDFDNPAVAADEINSWVATKTHDKIQSLVSSDSLSATTTLVLVNAIYFKGLWKTPFQKIRTINNDFFVQPNLPKQVSTMHLKAKLLTGNLDELNSRWLQLPFESDRFYLLIILPDEKSGVQRLVNQINGSEIFDLISNLESRGSSPEVVLSLPKFKLETTSELIPTLQEMGLTDIFSRQANLSGISQEPLFVSQVVQKAQLEVDEEGATAAAATDIDIKSTAVAVRPAPVNFTVDHPFLVLLVDGLNELPLFISRVFDPTTS